ncbi:MAG: 4Fe-4S dicluster domain-containing protein [Planctomycetota bacterium]|nr:MAG: 4Fe-4S dicluster domain-containing protein [Planctomycetota bacterium]
MLHNISTEELGPRGEVLARAIGTCVHCGFCLPACPTYQVLESEMDSPRGRILLMKSVLEGNLPADEAEPHIDRCLGCLACVTHCPSGVEYGELVTSYRAHIRSRGSGRQGGWWNRVRDWLAATTLPYPGRLRWALRMGRPARGLARFLPRALRPMVDLVPHELPAPIPLPEVSPAQGEVRGRVALLAGCGQQVLAPDINAAAVRVLNRQGIEVLIPPSQSCCGALDWHNGRAQRAGRFARSVLAAMPPDVDAIISTAAGCGSTLKEYELVLAGSAAEPAARALAARAHDIAEYLSRLNLVPIPPVKGSLRIAYQDACHLAHAQGIRAAPRKLLQSIPGVELCEIEAADTCCGSAGTYNIEHPSIAAELGRRKVETILQTRPDIVVTGNIGCLVQIKKHLELQGEDLPILHTVQVLDRAYRQILG